MQVTVTPTYSGCPAMDAIRTDVVDALPDAGFADAQVRTVLSPAWTTDWMSDEGRRKLLAYGVAPPTRPAGRHRKPDEHRTRAGEPLGALPAMRQRRHPRAEQVRLDGMQGPVVVQRVPRAVRPLQGDLSDRDSSRSAGTACSTPCGCRRSSGSPTTRWPITFDVPAELRDDYAFSAGQHLTCAPTSAATRCGATTRSARPRQQRPAARRRQAPRGRSVLGLRHQRLARRATAST